MLEYWSSMEVFLPQGGITNPLRVEAGLKSSLQFSITPTLRVPKARNVNQRKEVKKN